MSRDVVLDHLERINPGKGRVADARWDAELVLQDYLESIDIEHLVVNDEDLGDNTLVPRLDKLDELNCPVGQWCRNRHFFQWCKLFKHDGSTDRTSVVGFRGRL